MISYNQALPSAGQKTGPAIAGESFALVGRLFLAAIFLLSGVGKAGDPAGTIGYIGSAGIPLATIAYGGTVALEIGAGLALVIGYRTRLAATGLALFSVIAALLFHADFGDQNQFIHFMKNVAIAGGLLQVAAFGGGWFALDRRLPGQKGF